MNKKQLFILLLSCLTSSVWAEAITTRVSVANVGLQANADSFASRQAISQNGRYIAFQSLADDIDLTDHNNVFDVFVHDQWQKQTQRISVSNLGEGNSNSIQAVISDNGRMVAFTSYASNLSENDTNGVADIFLYDRFTGLLTNITQIADAASSNPMLSADGQRLVFESNATNLVAGDINAVSDIFIYDVATAQISRISTDSVGVEANNASYKPSISNDGSRIVFQSLATNLVLNDSNEKANIIFVDLNSGERRMLSVGENGAPANNHSYAPMISGSGLHVAFDTDASNLFADDNNGFSDIVFYDLTNNQLARMSFGLDGAPNYNTVLPSISDSGLYINYESAASNLVENDDNTIVDVFRVNRSNGERTKLSIASNAVAANFSTFEIGTSIASEQCFSSFSSPATNLVDEDSNKSFDVFLHTEVLDAATFQTVEEEGVVVGLLNIPTVALPTGQLYSVQLRWNGDVEDLSFALNGGEELAVGSANNACSFVAQDASLVYIPVVNALTAAGDVVARYEVTLQIKLTEEQTFTFALANATQHPLPQ
jgi:dipeptidyl aminopeptidase/acylaminoacyl peptidase